MLFKIFFTISYLSLTLNFYSVTYPGFSTQISNTSELFPLGLWWWSASQATLYEGEQFQFVIDFSLKVQAKGNPIIMAKLTKFSSMITRVHNARQC